MKTKLKTEEGFSTLTDKQLDCIAGVVIKYAKASDLNDYVDGKKSLKDVRGSKDEKTVENETVACVTAK